MKLSLNWIKKFVDVPAKYSAEELGHLVTMKTAEVEEVISQAKAFDKIVAGEIKEIGPHPDADKLQVTKVFDGETEHQVVCGASNIYVGMKSPFAQIGALVKWHGEGDLVEIKKAKVRGVESSGMICAGEEIGLEMGDPNGVVDLKDFDCEAGQPLAEVLGKNDVILDIDNKSLTHRPDLWSHYGFAREFSAFLDQPLKKYAVKDADVVGQEPKLKVKIKDQDICPRFAGCVMTGIKVGDSPQWLKNHLEAVGVRPVNNIVDVTNFVMLEYGQPMHAYDRKVVGEDYLEVRFAQEGEAMQTLDHKERKLNSEDIVIANSKEVLLLAGLMGGVNSEISDQTTEIILEAANWDPVLVRKMSTRLGMRTDSSARFEKSLDPQMCGVGVLKAIELIKEVCPGAQVEGGMTDVGDWQQNKIEVLISRNEIVSVIGVELEISDIEKVLKALEFEVQVEGEELKVKIPSFRATKDVDIKDDLIEEVARMYGYNNIPAILPELPIKLPEVNQERSLKHQAREILSYQLGFIETMNYSFYSKEVLENVGLSEEKHLQIENYLSEDQTHLRTTLVPNLLKSAVKNIDGKMISGALKMYEIGHTYLDEGNYFPKEEKFIGGIVVKKKGKTDTTQDAVFYEAKANLEFFLKQFGVQKYRLLAASENRDVDGKAAVYAHPVRSADLLIQNKTCARVFELHPLVKKKFNLEDWEVAVFEVNFTKLVATGQVMAKYQPVSKFPAIDVDISVVVDRSHKVLDIQKIIKKAQQKHKLSFLISQVKLFDLYEGENIGENKKALAFKVRFQSNERTLTSEEMNDAQKKIFADLQAAGGTVRGL